MTKGDNSYFNACIPLQREFEKHLLLKKHINSLADCFILLPLVRTWANTTKVPLSTRSEMTPSMIEQRPVQVIIV